MNTDAVRAAKERWDSFTRTLSPTELMELATYEEPVKSLDLFSYYINKDYARFDQVLLTLPKVYLYDEHVINMIFDSYMDRSFPEKALSYISGAIEYNNVTRSINGIDLSALQKKAMTDEFYYKTKQALLNLRNIAPPNIPQTIPEILNGKSTLREFILEEILNGLKIMRKKIRAIESIQLENKFNDVLLAILRLRFPIWGWDISDQNRSGSSPTGKDAGEIDFTITAAGKDIGLIEAFILKGSNTNVVESHILKCDKYINDLTDYYIVIYFQGPGKNFVNTWKSYQTKVVGIKYPPQLLIDKVKGFSDLSSIVLSRENIKAGETSHGTGITLHHIMIDLSGIQKRRPKKIANKPVARVKGKMIRPTGKGNR